MPLDDDDNPAATTPSPLYSQDATTGASLAAAGAAVPALPTASASATAAASAAAAAATTTTTDDLTAEDLLEDEGAASQDFAAFAASLQKTQATQQQQQFRKTAGVSAQTIRKGEKDFEAHGTRAQADALERSRAAMREVLGYTRVHAAASSSGSGGAGSGGAATRGWVFPGWWEGYVEEVVLDEGEEGKEGSVGGEKKGEGKERKPYGHIRERVVLLEGSSPANHSLGRAVTGQAKDRPARGKDWLLPEEALYLVERGSLDLWWPLKTVEEMFPAEGAAAGKEEKGNEEGDADEYELGFPLSLQAAYALLVGEDGERGKISLRKFQVYSNLKRCGYNVLRAPPTPRHPATPPSTTVSTAPITTTLWQWLTSLLARPPQHKPYGPLVQPGLYRSYAAIYRQLALLPRHSPSSLTTTTTSSSTSSSTHPTPHSPFTIHFHVWKSAQKWTKLRHPSPDFRLAVVDAQDSAVPSLDAVSTLLASTPPQPGKPEWAGHPGRLYARLKHGYRNVLVAVVDHGVINYMRFAEGTFGAEELFGRFDVARGGGKKGGGRNNGRGGRGGKGGRGRGGGGGGRGRGRGR